MDKKEQKRLKVLQDDGPKGVGGIRLKTLTYPDLQLLLVEDPIVRRLIAELIEPTLQALQEKQVACGTEESSASAANHAVIVAEEATENLPSLAALAPAIIHTVIEKVPYEVRIEVPVFDPLREELTTGLELLKAVQEDTELAQQWLWATETEGQMLMRLFATVSEFDELLRLWGVLADRCKTEKREATSLELRILEGVLTIHNLRWRDREAKIVTVDIGTSFHHEAMERGTPKGNTVAAVWLPGIENVSGVVQKKPLVRLN